MPTRGEIIEALRNVEDPELLINIVDLGLVYRAEVVNNRIEVDYTLTFPARPLSEEIEEDIFDTLGQISDMEVKTTLVWNPRWSPDYMSDEAKVTLGYPV